MPETKPLTIDDLLSLQAVADARVDPSGRRVAYVVADNVAGYQEPGPLSSIWLTDVDEARPRRVSYGPGADDQPRWSPDSQQLVFRSDRGKRGTFQLYRLGGDLAEAEPLAELAGGVTGFAWAADSRSLLVLAREARPDRPEGRDEIVFEEDAPATLLWRLDLASGELAPITDGSLSVWEIAPAPDGSSVAAIVTDLPYNWSWYRSRLARIDLQTGRVTTLYRPERQIARPCWLADGSAVAVVACTWSDPGMTGGDVMLIPAGGGEARNLTQDEPRSHMTLHPCPDGRSLLTAAGEDGRAALCRVSLDGPTETLWSGERAFVSYGMSASRDGAVVAAALSSPSEPADVWVARLGDDRRSLSWERRGDHNPGLAGRAAGRTETLTWRAPDGLEIAGLLVRPDDAPRGQPLPLVTFIHGGPTGAWDYGFPARGALGWIPLLAARGIAVLLPNPRGSNGRGVAFAEANHGDMGGGDLSDILAGVDACVARGIADPDRLGVCGWSYGGYLTPWALTRTDRFKAAISGASITNWFSFHGGTDIPGFDETFFRADPYALDGPYALRSPLFSVDRVRTPTLFFHGQDDPCCPVGQATEMFRALRARGVETRCVLYPREGHGIQEREHRRDLLQRGVDWMVERLRTD